MPELSDSNLVDVLVNILERYQALERLLSVDENEVEQVRLFMFDNNERFESIVNKLAGHVPDGLTFFERIDRLHQVELDAQAS